jgi:hypothetical protein
MTIIKGILTDTTGVPLAGKLSFAPLQVKKFDATTPHATRFPAVRTYAIASDGIVAVDVPESQTLDVPYVISFEPTEPVSPITELLVAIVPKARSIELGDLIPAWSEDLCARG